MYANITRVLEETYGRMAEGGANHAAGVADPLLTLTGELGPRSRAPPLCLQLTLPDQWGPALRPAN